MSGRVLIFLNRGSFEPAYQAASLAVTASAMGDEVWVVLAFDALRAWAQGTFGVPSSAAEAASCRRAGELGVMAPQAMMAEARTLGAHLVACDTTVKLTGLPAGIEDKLDEILGLPSIWRMSQGARVLSV